MLVIPLPALALLMALSLTGSVSGLDCAVCLPADEETTIGREIRRLFPNDPDLIPCHSVATTNASLTERIIRTCPPEASASCHTQKTGGWTAKSCSAVKVQDCKKANRVEYCYCLTDRCNALSGHKSHRHHKGKATTTTTTTTTESSGVVTNRTELHHHHQHHHQHHQSDFIASGGSATWASDDGHRVSLATSLLLALTLFWPSLS